MPEREFTVEVCQGQICHFFGKNVLNEIAEGVADMNNVATREGNCRGSCTSATNVYVFKEDSLKTHYTRVNRKNGPGPSTDEVIASIKTEATNDH